MFTFSLKMKIFTHTPGDPEITWGNDIHLIEGEREAQSVTAKIG